MNQVDSRIPADLFPRWDNAVDVLSPIIHPVCPWSLGSWSERICIYCFGPTAPIYICRCGVNAPLSTTSFQVRYINAPDHCAQITRSVSRLLMLNSCFCSTVAPLISIIYRHAGAASVSAVAVWLFGMPCSTNHGMPWNEPHVLVCPAQMQV